MLTVLNPQYTGQKDAIIVGNCHLDSHMGAYPLLLWLLNLTLHLDGHRYLLPAHLTMVFVSAASLVRAVH